MYLQNAMKNLSESEDTRSPDFVDAKKTIVTILKKTSYNQDKHQHLNESRVLLYRYIENANRKDEKDFYQGLVAGIDEYLKPFERGKM